MNPLLPNIHTSKQIKHIRTSNKVKTKQNIICMMPLHCLFQSWFALNAPRTLHFCYNSFLITQQPTKPFFVVAQKKHL